MTPTPSRSLGPMICRISDFASLRKLAPQTGVSGTPVCYRSRSHSSSTMRIFVPPAFTSVCIFMLFIPDLF